MLKAEELRVSTLGEARHPSPLRLGPPLPGYIDDRARIAYRVDSLDGESLPPEGCFEAAGPRERIFFDPTTTRAGVVTCGGLCPGLNNVVRSLVLELHHKYGIQETLGFQFGYEGLTRKGQPPMRLSPRDVAHIHQQGGSVLGQSRGQQDVAEMVDRLQELGVNLLFAVGGDGTLRGAHKIWLEAERRGAKIAVIGVPKTIDNDVAYVDRTFGFETAVEVARQALDSAHVEALATRGGVGLVKLMGRDAGFIAAAATRASREVNFCLVPEVPFRLDGPGGLLEALARRLDQRSHALIAVAEGCGSSLQKPESEHDASGNVRYGSPDLDIGPFLRDTITSHFKAQKRPISLKYIDPSYMIRSVPANASDSIYCDALARHAAHAAMAGKTDMVVGRWNGRFTHVPLALVTSSHKRLDPTGDIWFAVTEATGQPPLVLFKSWFLVREPVPWGPGGPGAGGLGGRGAGLGGRGAGGLGGWGAGGPRGKARWSTSEGATPPPRAPGRSGGRGGLSAAPCWPPDTPLAPAGRAGTFTEATARSSEIRRALPSLARPFGPGPALLFAARRERRAAGGGALGLISNRLARGATLAPCCPALPCPALLCSALLTHRQQERGTRPAGAGKRRDGNANREGPRRCRACHQCTTGGGEGGVGGPEGGRRQAPAAP